MSRNNILWLMLAALLVKAAAAAAGCTSTTTVDNPPPVTVVVNNPPDMVVNNPPPAKVVVNNPPDVVVNNPACDGCEQSPQHRGQQPSRDRGRDLEVISFFPVRTEPRRAPPRSRPAAARPECAAHRSRTRPRPEEVREPRRGRRWHRGSDGRRPAPPPSRPRAKGRSPRRRIPGRRPGRRRPSGRLDRDHQVRDHRSIASAAPRRPATADPYAPNRGFGTRSVAPSVSPTRTAPGVKLAPSPSSIAACTTQSTCFDRRSQTTSGPSAFWSRSTPIMNRPVVPGRIDHAERRAAADRVDHGRPVPIELLGDGGRPGRVGIAPGVVADVSNLDRRAGSDRADPGPEAVAKPVQDRVRHAEQDCDRPTMAGRGRERACQVRDSVRRDRHGPDIRTRRGITVDHDESDPVGCRPGPPAPAHVPESWTTISFGGADASSARAASSRSAVAGANSSYVNVPFRDASRRPARAASIYGLPGSPAYDPDRGDGSGRGEASARAQPP